MKMNRLTYLPILIGCVVTGLLPLSCTPAPRKEKETLILKDPSGTRLWEDVSPSGIPFSETKGFTDRKAYHLEEGFVALEVSRRNHHPAPLDLGQHGLRGWETQIHEWSWGNDAAGRSDGVGEAAARTDG